MKNLPLRFRAGCTFCNEELDIREVGVYSLQTGWMKNRSQGGGNALALREQVKPGMYACPFCIESRQHGTVGQATLFA
jgi:hypothetical protein